MSAAGSAVTDLSLDHDGFASPAHGGHNPVATLPYLDGDAGTGLNAQPADLRVRLCDAIP